MEFFVKNYQKFSLDDEEFLEILMEILLISGLGMTIVGGSYPASQSEHLISHAIEMKHKNNSLHGQQIAVTTVVTSKIQGTLLEKWLKLGEISQIQKGFFLQDEILQFFGEEIMKECEAEYREKIFEDKKLKEINKNIAENYLEIIADLQKIYFPKNNLIKIFEHFKIDYSAQSLGISKEEFSLCQKYAKYIRNRFTCLDLI
jgi:glycerol-1-phosphate dehydrogenase [NAD(P)+]